MSDEETTEETPVEEAPVEEAPAAEAPTEETPAAEEAPAAEASAEAAPAAEEEDAEPAEKPTSKQLRKRSRSTHSGEAGPQRSNEERAAARAELRKAKAAARRRWRGKQKAKRAAAGAGVPTPAVVREPGNPTVRQGVVVSDKGDKTITVRIDVARRHPKYEKIVRSSSTVRVHDERNDANEGDTVRVIECRPMSATKRWRLDEVVERAR